MLKNNYFTKEYQKFFQRLKLESLEEYISLYHNSYSKFKCNFSQYYSNYTSLLKNHLKERGEEIPFTESDGEGENNLFDDYASFDTNPAEASSGYTTILSENDDNKESNLIHGGSFKDPKNNIFNNIFNTQECKFNEYTDSNMLLNNKKNQMGKSFNNGNPNSLNAEGQAFDRLNNLKINKNQLTIRQRTKEEIKEFQRQELERYKKPHLPWKYVHPDSSTSVVAPVQKKIPTSGQTKPRDHVLLKPDRPSYVTILCLARDAASRLPEGVGTRADICDLLKDSQYTNERLSDAQINNIVSGALDRLHYEKDPCVKYDLQKKLWIYLHKSRTLEYEPWNEHLKKNNMSSTGEPINPNLIMNDNNINNTENKEGIIDIGSSLDNKDFESESENQDEVDDLDENSELVKNEPLNILVNKVDLELQASNSASEDFINVNSISDKEGKNGNHRNYNFYDDGEKASEDEIENKKIIQKKAKNIKKSFEKKPKGKMSMIISISKNFENEINTELKLNEDNHNVNVNYEIQSKQMI